MKASPRLLALAAALVLAALWAAWGVRLRLRHAERAPPPPGQLRGAWHVHTTHSDGRGTLDEVVAAARAAGLQFVVVTDHNVVTPSEGGWRDGVLVVEAHEASTRWGHVVALGTSRALDAVEREGDPLQAIAALGGQAVLAHPLHASRPFGGWGHEPWRGLELVSNDTAWGEVVAGRSLGRALAMLAALPFDAAQGVVALLPTPDREARALDQALEATPPGPRRPDGRLAPGRVLLCSDDAHGYPTYQAAFQAFSMHVPVTPTGSAGADTDAILGALLDGRAACVLDAVAPVRAVALEPGADGTILLRLDAEAAGRAEPRLLSGGADVGPPVRDPLGWRFRCGGGCRRGAYRAEVRLDGRPWIFTNAALIE